MIKLRKKRLTPEFIKTALEEHNISPVGMTDSIVQEYCQWWNNDMVFLPSPQVQQFIQENSQYFNNYINKRTITGKMILQEYLTIFEENNGGIETIPVLAELGKRYGVDLNFLIQLKQAITRDAYTHLDSMPRYLCVGDKQYVNLNDETMPFAQQAIVASKPSKSWYVDYQNKCRDLEIERVQYAVFDQFYDWYRNDYIARKRESLDVTLTGYALLDRTTVNELLNVMKVWFPRKAQGDVILLYYDFRWFPNVFEEMDQKEYYGKQHKYFESKRHSNVGTL